MEGFRDHIIPYDHTVTRTDREKRSGSKARVLWFTGLSGSGKSTLANGLETFFHNQGLPTYILDGDNIRHGLNKNLGFKGSTNFFLRL